MAQEPEFSGSYLTIGEINQDSLGLLKVGFKLWLTWRGRLRVEYFARRPLCGRFWGRSLGGNPPHVVLIAQV